MFVQEDTACEQTCPIRESIGNLAKALIFVADKDISRLSLRRDDFERDDLNGMCLGMGCMMWRAEKSQRWYDGESTGYCGLAGRPLPYLEDGTETDTD
jgi:hypothetical protein